MSQREQDPAVSTPDVIGHGAHLWLTFQNENEWTSRRITGKSQILNTNIDQVKVDFCKRVVHILFDRIFEEI